MQNPTPTIRTVSSSTSSSTISTSSSSSSLKRTSNANPHNPYRHSHRSPSQSYPSQPYYPTTNSYSSNNDSYYYYHHRRQNSSSYNTPTYANMNPYTARRTSSSIASPPVSPPLPPPPTIVISEDQSMRSSMNANRIRRTKPRYYAQQHQYDGNAEEVGRGSSSSASSDECVDEIVGEGMTGRDGIVGRKGGRFSLRGLVGWGR